MTFLRIRIHEAGYGKKVIIKDISLGFTNGDIAAFIGPNGAGKSTFLKAIMGLVDFKSGSIIYKDDEILRLPAEEKIKKGIAFVPQGNRVFTELCVKENLEVGGYLIKSRKELKSRIEEVTNLFPLLKERLKQTAGDLSGGEKQQLAIARALMLKPEVLLLDEPSLGLSPSLVKIAFDKVRQLNEELGVTVLIVEQKVKEVLNIAHNVYAFRLGEIVSEGSPDMFTPTEMSRIFLT